MARENISDTLYRDIGKAYKIACKNIPNKEIERHYILRAQQGDAFAREQLFNRHLPIIADVAMSRNFATFSGCADELIAAASFALDSAIAGFDLSMGTTFLDYFLPKVRDRISKENHASHLVHYPENVIKSSGFRDGTFSLNGVDEEGNALIDKLVDKDSTDFVDDIHNVNLHEVLGRAVENLSDREQDVIKAMFLECDDNPTFQEVSENLNISKQRVHQIHLKALAHLRELLAPEKDRIL